MVDDSTVIKITKTMILISFPFMQVCSNSKIMYHLWLIECYCNTLIYLVEIRFWFKSFQMKPI